LEKNILLFFAKELRSRAVGNYRGRARALFAVKKRSRALG